MTTNVSKSEFGRRLYQLRTEKELSLRKLANLLGISKTSIENYEKGVNYPKVEHLIEISKLFEVSVDTLLGFEYEVVADVTGLEPTQIDYINKMIESSKNEFLKSNRKKANPKQ